MNKTQISKPSRKAKIGAQIIILEGGKKKLETGKAKTMTKKKHPAPGAFCGF